MFEPSERIDIMDRVVRRFYVIGVVLGIILGFIVGFLLGFLGASDSATGITVGIIGAVIGALLGYWAAWWSDFVIYTTFVRVDEILLELRKPQKRQESYQENKVDTNILDIKETLERIEQNTRVLQVPQGAAAHLLAAGATQQMMQGSAGDKAKESTGCQPVVTQADAGAGAGGTDATVTDEGAQKRAHVKEIPDELKALIDAADDESAAAQMGITALMKAAWQNADASTIEDLVASGVYVNAKAKNGMTALTCDAAANADPEVVRALIVAGADVNVRVGILSHTPLMFAAGSCESDDVIKALVSAGANVNEQDKMGQSALIHAVQKNESPDVVKALLEAGADVSIQDNVLKTAMDYFDTDRREGFYGTPSYWAIRSLLLEWGA